MDDSKASMISKYIDGLNFDDHSNYKQLINETISTVLFKKYIKNNNFILSVHILNTYFFYTLTTAK